MLKWTCRLEKTIYCTVQAVMYFPYHAAVAPGGISIAGSGFKVGIKSFECVRDSTIEGKHSTKIAA